MMILPLADALQNCLQNLTSRIAGIDNEQMTNRVMGMSAALGFGVGAIKEQFKTPSKNTGTGNKGNSSDDSSGGGFKGFVSRAKSIINPSGLNLSAEKDYNGNVNPIRDNIKSTNINKSSNITNNNTSNSNVTSNNGTKSKIPSAVKSVTTGVLKTGYGATKAYLKARCKFGGRRL